MIIVLHVLHIKWWVVADSSEIRICCCLLCCTNLFGPVKPLILLAIYSVTLSSSMDLWVWCALIYSETGFFLLPRSLLIRIRPLKLSWVPYIQCCRSGIRDPVPFWPPGSGIRELRNIFGLKYLNSFIRIRNLFWPSIRDEKYSGPRSGININSLKDQLSVYVKVQKAAVNV
jgi:hypothetical protein